ncbi:MAG: hypothetical protein M3Z46_13575 [Actinomycetota bacterium]|nr:hypothetical protein [Actinomycetota bacterium]
MHVRPRRATGVVLVGALIGALCATVTPVGARTQTQPSIVVSAPHAERCDPIGGPRCYLPFPNDFFTVASRRTATGRRVDLRRASMPANKDGVHIDPTEQNRNDGFSPGSALVALFPGLDLTRTGAAPRTDIGASLASDAPIVLIDADTGKRVAYWSELDSNATTDATRLLYIRPAANFAEGHRFVVGLRDLKDAAGNPIAPTDAFRAYRDSLDTHNRTLERRRWAMERIFADLHRAGVNRHSLALAWDFTVASGRNLSERLLHMRDDAFAQLGTAAPQFHVDSVQEATTGPLLRTVTGTFEVPRYLTGTGAPGSTLNNGRRRLNALPDRNGTQTANFVCTVPRLSVGPDGNARPGPMALYGHGLLGTASQVIGVGTSSAAVTSRTFCATDWIGMASEDIGNVVAILQDLSKFRSLADRLQQGILNFLFLGRLLKNANGFSTNPAFEDAHGHSLLDNMHLTFVGNSQGGILGGATSAVAQDWTRVLLGVPGMNYSTLLNRSVDFDEFGAILNPSYPDEVDRQMGILLDQMLWDRGENDGYAEHLTSHPYEGTEAKHVLLFEAYGDHQVTNIATEVMARTIHARLRVPALAPGRSPDVEPFWHIRPIPQLPAQGGSYLVMWDFGTPTPPIGNLPNRAGEDPHGKGSGEPRVLTMSAEFLRSGNLIDVCNGGPCQTPP